MCFVNLVFLLWYINPDKIKLVGKFDYLGTITIVVSILCLCLMFTFLRYKQYILSGSLFAVSVICLIIFFVVEKRHQNPIIPLYLLKNPLGETIMMNLINYIAITGVSYTYPQYCKIMKISSSLVGIIQTVSMTFGFVMSLVLQFMQKRIVHRITLAIFFVGYGVLIGLQGLLLQNVWLFIVIYVVLIGLGNGTSQTLYPMMMMSVPSQLSAQVSVIPPTSRTLAQSLSFCLYSSLIEICMGLFRSAPEDISFSAAMQICLLLVILLILICTVVGIYRLGNAGYESGKRGFLQQFVRQVPVPAANTKVVQMQ